MTRTYNSRRRDESASSTRQAIVEAAVRMHGEGIATFAAIADAAGVSLPTVNKYFPSREDLFTACTSHVASQLSQPAPEEFSAIDDPGERLRAVVQAIYGQHDQIVGQSWMGYRLEDESPVLADTMKQTETFIASLAATLHYDNAIGDRDTVMRFVQAALNPLTYRALRVKNGLTLDEAVANMTLALAGLLNIAA